jgi:hypothetical protein
MKLSLAKLRALVCCCTTLLVPADRAQAQPAKVAMHRPFSQMNVGRRSEVAPVQSADAPTLTFTFGTMDFPGAYASNAEAINDKKQVVGVFSSTCFNSFYCTGSPVQGFRLSGSSFAKVNYPGAVSTAPAGMNKHGEVVGAYLLSDGIQHGFALVGKTFKTVDYPGSTYSGATGINDGGDITGIWGDAGGNLHGYLYSGGKFTAIDLGDSTYTEADGINNAGDIVGIYLDAVGYHGYVIHGGVPATVDFPGAESTGVYGINNHGQMVGAWGIGSVQRNDQQHGFFYDGKTFTSFDVPFSGVVVTSARGINDKSQVVGTYEDSTVNDYGFIASFK